MYIFAKKNIPTWSIVILSATYELLVVFITDYLVSLFSIHLYHTQVLWYKVARRGVC